MDKWIKINITEKDEYVAKYYYITTLILNSHLKGNVLETSIYYQVFKMSTQILYMSPILEFLMHL